LQPCRELEVRAPEDIPIAYCEIPRPATAPPVIAVPSLRVTFTWTLVGNVVYALCQWAMISGLAKLGTTAAVGQFALALAITAPVFMLTNLQLRGVQATDAKSLFEFGDYFTLRIIGTCFALAVVVLILGISKYGRTTSLVVILVAIAKAVESLSDVVAGLLQRYERLDQIAIAMMLKGGFSAMLFTAAYALWRSVEAASLCLCVTWLLVFLGYDLQLARRLLKRKRSFVTQDRRRLLDLARSAAPLGIVMALSSLNGNIPRYVVQRYRGTGELGIFAALAYLVVVVGLIANALGQSAVVRLSRSFAEGRTREFTRLLRRMSFIGLGVAGGGVLLAILFGRAALTLIYGPVYATHVSLLILLIVTSGVTAVAAFLGFGMTAARQFKAQVPIIVATVATCAVLALILTPRWGLIGSGLAILIATLVQTAGSVIVLVNTIRHWSVANDCAGAGERLAEREAVALFDSIGD
jgi:O-antigen/teichoic acid export membrane protein